MAICNGRSAIWLRKFGDFEVLQRKIKDPQRHGVEVYVMADLQTFIEAHCAEQGVDIWEAA